MRYLKPLFVLTLFKVLTLGCNVYKPHEVNMKDVRSMLISDDIKKIEVVNEDIALIYLKPERLKKYKNLSDKYILGEKGPQFEIQIGDVFSFDKNVMEGSNNKIIIDYKIKKKYLMDLLFISFPLLILIIIILLSIFWLVLLIEILRADFKNSTDKLIWIIIISLAPIIGLILYIVIGRKQKIKNISSLK